MENYKHLQKYTTILRLEIDRLNSKISALRKSDLKSLRSFNKTLKDYNSLFKLYIELQDKHIELLKISNKK